ncbi:MAG: hypothetical protein ABSE90_11060, partial [Verrucomicrobiota bacterium]
MKSIRNFLIGIAITGSLAASLHFLHAQETAMPVQAGAISAVDWHSASDLQVMLQVVEMMPTVSADSLPRFGTFYSAQHSPGSPEPWPPMPGNARQVPVWNLGDGIYLLNDEQVDYSVSPSSMRMARGRMMAANGMEPPGAVGGGDGTNGFYSDSFYYTPPTNGLFLEVTNVSNGFAYLNLHNATNAGGVYEIFSKTDLTAPSWNIEQELWPTDTNCTPFVLSLNPQPSTLFIWARDWTGITSGGNQTPEWWFWKYYGTVDLSDSDLDSQGNSLLYDYQNGIDPNVIQYFMLQFPFEVNTNIVSGTISTFGGQPSYIAVLVNDTNTADAVWQPYTGTNITVSLNGGNGLYTVSVGLKGLPPDATQTWAPAEMIYSAPVALAIKLTSPSATVATPLVQVRGLANQGLVSLTYDVSNALGVVTNLQGCWQEMFYDTNIFKFTTNSFQCYDVRLTNGVNSITLHATDVNGDTVTTNFNVTLDYLGDTTPPVLSIIWPQSGTQISGSKFTLQAQMDDATATVTASIVDTNGNTKVVSGLVERSGAVWFNDLPLGGGTNMVTVTATDAAGNMSVTSLNVIGNDVGLVIDPISSDQLNQSSVMVTGSIGDPADDCVWVNGVQASVDPDTGDWEADDVPVSPTGTATLSVQVYEGDPVLIASQNSYQDQPATVVMSSYS